MIWYLNHSALFVGILYQIRKVSLEDGSYMYCLWIAKDLEDGDIGKRFGSLTVASKDNVTLDTSLGEVRIEHFLK